MGFDEFGVRTLTLCWAVQLGKTETILNIIGRQVHFDPCPIMVVYPKREACDKFMRERLGPMIRECAPLLERFDPRLRMGEDSLKFKQVRGGFIALESAGSPMDLASRAVALVLMDEIDKYEDTKEGPAVKLAEARMATFGQRAKSVRVCSPTLTDKSRIFQSYMESDQRRAFIACEHCQHEFSPRFFQHVQWNKSEHDHFPATAAIFCPKCGSAMSEDWRRKQVTTKLGIKWRQTRPFLCCNVEQMPEQTESWDWDDENQIGYATCINCGKRTVPNDHAGYQASQLLSPFTTVAALATDWISVKESPEDKMTWRNSKLGEPADVEQVTDNVDIADLLERREELGEYVPDEVVGIFAGVDVQTGSDLSDGSLHCYVWGFTLDRQMYSLHTSILEGDVRLDVTWRRLDDIFRGRFYRKSGVTMSILAACVDAGDGKISEVVIDYCRKRRASNIYAVKGSSERVSAWGEIWPGVKAKKTRETGFRVKMIGSNAAKMAIYTRLGQREGSGTMHFGMDWDKNQFYQLIAEKLVHSKRGGIHRSQVRAATWSRQRSVGWNGLCAHSLLGLDRARTFT